MSALVEDGLRKRVQQVRTENAFIPKALPCEPKNEDASATTAREEIVWGKTPEGQGVPLSPSLCHLSRLSSFQFSAFRRHTMSSPPSFTLPTPNPTLTSSTSAFSRSKSSFFAPCRALPARYSSFFISHSGGLRMMLGWDMC
jgi:hypothetical protein